MFLRLHKENYFFNGFNQGNKIGLLLHRNFLSENFADELYNTIGEGVSFQLNFFMFESLVDRFQVF